MFKQLIEKGFQIRFLHHAEAILLHDMEEAICDIEKVLLDVSIPVLELIQGGGGESKVTQRMRRIFAENLGWPKHNFQVVKTVDGVQKESKSHEVDHIKKFDGGTLALEIEWNNKDPFFDRDLENFKRLHAEGVISVGVIITRGTSLQRSLRNHIREFALSRNIASVDDLEEFYTPTKRQIEKINNTALSIGDFSKGWAHAFVADKFGTATTHWEKLEDRINRGVGNPCPLLLIGLPGNIITSD